MRSVRGGGLHPAGVFGFRLPVNAGPRPGRGHETVLQGPLHFNSALAAVATSEPACQFLPRRHLDPQRPSHPAPGTPPSRSQPNPRRGCSANSPKLFLRGMVSKTLRGRFHGRIPSHQFDRPLPWIPQATVAESPGWGDRNNEEPTGIQRGPANDLT